MRYKVISNSIKFIVCINYCVNKTNLWLKLYNYNNIIMEYGNIIWY